MHALILYQICMACLFLGVTGARTWDDFRNGDPYIAKLLSLDEGHYPCIIMGDSVIEATFPTDHDSRSIHKMLGDFLGQKVLNVAIPGLPLSEQTQLLDFLLQKKIKADLLVLEINPFQMMWRDDPKRSMDWQEKTKADLLVLETTPLQIMWREGPKKLLEWKKPLDTIPSAPLAVHEFFNHILTLDHKLLSGSEERKKENLDLSNPNVQYYRGAYTPEQLKKIEILLDEVALRCAAIAPEILFFITPVNLEALKMDSSIFTCQNRQETVQTIESKCQDLPIAFINLYDGLPHMRYFPDVGYCHLTDEGRKFVVDKITQKISTNSSPGNY